MTITVYSTVTCPYCQMLKNYFKEHNLNFQEKLVDQDDGAREEMMALSDGFLGVPYTVVTKDDGGREKVIGFDKGKLDQVLQIVQK